MSVRSLYDIYKRFRTLQSGHISTLPIVILMPHSACNCRCVMCDIWKDNKNLKQLTENDIRDLLISLKKFGTRTVVMSGGEPLLNPNFFRLCELLRNENIKITLLSTGLSVRNHASDIMALVNDLIVSLDGNELVHDLIRNIPGAYRKLRNGVQHIKSLDPDFKITARTVIHRINFRYWPSIVDSAVELGVDQISFLPADVSSHAFNRMESWSDARQHEILPEQDELSDLKSVIDDLLVNYKSAFRTGFIAESPEKLLKIHTYYEACYGLSPYPYKRCNAPWVSAVIEADGTVRPCFFHQGMGNIHTEPLGAILNGSKALNFRKTLDMVHDDTCMRCVCSLHLSPHAKI